MHEQAPQTRVTEVFRSLMVGTEVLDNFDPSVTWMFLRLRGDDERAVAHHRSCRRVADNHCLADRTLLLSEDKCIGPGGPIASAVELTVRKIGPESLQTRLDGLLGTVCFSIHKDKFLPIQL